MSGIEKELMEQEHEMIGCIDFTLLRQRLKYLASGGTLKFKHFNLGIDGIKVKMNPQGNAIYGVDSRGISDTTLLAHLVWNQGEWSEEIDIEEQFKKTFEIFPSDNDISTYDYLWLQTLLPTMEYPEFKNVNALKDFILKKLLSNYSEDIARKIRDYFEVL